MYMIMIYTQVAPTLFDIVYYVGVHGGASVPGSTPLGTPDSGTRYNTLRAMLSHDRGSGVLRCTPAPQLPSIQCTGPPSYLTFRVNDTDRKYYRYGGNPG